MTFGCSETLKWCVLATTLSVAVSGCGGGSDGSTSSDGSGSANTGGSDTMTVSGQAVDGPIEGADITVVDEDGNVVVSLEDATDANGLFSLDLPADTAFPVEIRLTGGTDQVTEQEIDTVLKSLLVEPPTDPAVDVTVNVNPASSVIVEVSVAKAGELQQVTETVVDEARTSVVNEFELTVEHPVTQPVEGDDAETFLEEQQALGEALRRSVSSVVPGEDFGQQVASVARALGQDLADGTLDGADENGDAVEPGVSQSVLNRLDEVRNEIAQGLLNVTTAEGGLTSIQDFGSRVSQAARGMRDAMAETDGGAGTGEGSGGTDGERGGSGGGSGEGSTNDGPGAGGGEGSGGTAGEADAAGDGSAGGGSNEVGSGGTDDS